MMDPSPRPLTRKEVLVVQGQLYRHLLADAQSPPSASSGWAESLRSIPVSAIVRVALLLLARYYRRRTRRSPSQAADAWVRRLAMLSIFLRVTRMVYLALATPTPRSR